MLAKNLTYSAKTNQLYTLSSPNSLGVSTSVAISALSIENPTCMNNSPAASVGALTATTPATVDSTATGTPLAVPAPLELQHPSRTATTIRFAWSRTLAS
jgi:hypothetical protein